MSKYNVSKLPVWAQDEIRVLEMRLREARTTIEEQSNPGPTRIAVNHDWMEEGKADFWARDDAHVRFFLSDGKWISVELEGDRLHLHGSNGPLVIRPHVSNVVTVDVEQ